jgi:hypothetical protein
LQPWLTSRAHRTLRAGCAGRTLRAGRSLSASGSGLSGRTPLRHHSPVTDGGQLWIALAPNLDSEPSIPVPLIVDRRTQLPWLFMPFAANW